MGTLCSALLLYSVASTSKPISLCYKTCQILLAFYSVLSNLTYLSVVCPSLSLISLPITGFMIIQHAGGMIKLF